jgi:hypothetical protein
MAVGTSRVRMRSVLPALIFSVALSLALVGGSKVVSAGNLTAIGFSSNHLTPFHAVDALWALLLTALFTVIAMQVPGAYLWMARRGLKGRVPVDRRQSRLLQLAVTVGLAVAWLPTLLTYAPGGVNADALFSIRQALYAGSSIPWDNHHPVVYALYLRGLISIGTAFHSVILGVFVASIVQFLVMAAACGYSVAWLARKGAPTVFVALAALFFALFPAFWLFAVGLSQDSLFAVLVLLYSLHLVDVIESDGKLLATVRGGATFAALSLLVMFARNNGFLVVVGAGLALICVYRLRVKALYPLLIGVLAFTAIVQGPVYDAFKVEKPTVEALAVPLQQMAYVVVTGGDLTASDKAFLYGLLPADQWPLSYAPAGADPLKRATTKYNETYLDKNKVAAARTWLSMLSRNPVPFAKAYMLETFGYWKPVLGVWPAIPVEPIVKNRLAIHRSDLIARVTGRSLAPVYDAFTSSMLWHVCLNVGVAVWLAFLAAATLISLGRARYLVALAPCVFSWLGFMVAAPVAFAYRYLLMFVIGLPVILLLPLIATRASSAAAPEEGALTPVA